mgnify:CR=1 FL=1
MPLKDTYILLGSAGSGKSTQAELLKSSLHLAHIDIGAELRAVAAHDTDLGRQVNEIINVKHEFVPDDVVFAVLTDAVHSVPETVGLLIDGIPRRESQISRVLELLQESGRINSGQFQSSYLHNSFGIVHSKLLLIMCSDSHGTHF